MELTGTFFFVIAFIYHLQFFTSQCNGFRPLVGLIIAVLNQCERYEQALAILEKVSPNVHHSFLHDLNSALSAAKANSLFGIHDEEALSQLGTLLTLKIEHCSIWNDVYLKVSF